MSPRWTAQGRAAKKDRKRKRQQAGSSVAPATTQPSAPTGVRPQATFGAPRPAARPSGTISLRPEDYAYVYNDLKRIAVLAGLIFGVMIILSFVIK